MKGVIFTELIEMMEDLMGLEFANKVIEDAELENEGAYTAIGTYPHQDLLKLLSSLSKHASNPQDKLMKSYGEYLFYRFSVPYKKILQQHSGVFSFLPELYEIIELEIKKLDSGAELPYIATQQTSPTSMEVLYRSKRKMSELLEGMIQGCIGYYQEPIGVKRENLEADGSKVKFLLQKNKAHE